MSGQGDGHVVIAAYRPKPGCDDALLALVKRHMPALRREGLVTARKALLLRAADGTLLEIFEWKPGGAEAAHANPVVGALWGEFAEVAEFPPTGSVVGMEGRFPNFAPMDGVVEGE